MVQLAKTICERCEKVFMGGPDAYICHECRKKAASKSCKTRNLSRMGREAQRIKPKGRKRQCRS